MSLDVVGKLARVTAEIAPGDLGEVMIEVRQSTSAGRNRYSGSVDGKQAG